MFKCYEILNTLDLKYMPSLYMIVSELSILTLTDIGKANAKVYECRNIVDLREIRKSGEDGKIMTFSWIGKSGIIEHSFIVEEANDCLNLVVKNIEKYGAKSEQIVKQKQDLPALLTSLGNIDTEIASNKSIAKLEQRSSILSDVMIYIDSRGIHGEEG